MITVLQPVVERDFFMLAGGFPAPAVDRLGAKPWRRLGLATGMAFWQRAASATLQGLDSLRSLGLLISLDFRLRPARCLQAVTWSGCLAV